MKITLLAGGSRGDTQPYIALGVALKKPGHTVRIATFETFRSLVESHNLEIVPIKGDIKEIAAGFVGEEAMQADSPLKVVLSFKKLSTLAGELQKDFYSACVGSDIIVYHPGHAIGHFYAKMNNIPAVFASPFPMTPTREYPALLFSNLPLKGGAFNLLTHRIFEKIMWSAAAPSTKNFLKEKLGSVPADFGCVYGRQNTPRFPTVISCSNYVFPRPGDWSPNIHQSGYWFLEDTGSWQPPDELQKFLASGKPPVYVGFGSLGDPAKAKETTRLVIAALQQAGQRGLLAAGWSALEDTGDLPKDFYMLKSAPHSWLFPRMAAVIHHGGAGTTAEGLRAGVPSILVPFANDQFAWGKRVFELGAGPRPIPRKKLTIEKLAAAIDLALQPQIVKQAALLGEKIRSEHGAEDCARAILAAAE